MNDGFSAVLGDGRHGSRPGAMDERRPVISDPVITAGSGPNTAMSYLYRDASNYKTLGRAVFSGQATQVQVEAILARRDDGQFIIPSQVGLVDVCPDEWTDDDHCWHEIEADSFELTSEQATDGPFDAFVKLVEEVEWQPYERPVYQRECDHEDAYRDADDGLVYCPDCNCTIPDDDVTFDASSIEADPMGAQRRGL